MAQGIGGELYMICPTLEKTRIGTTFVSDLIAGGAYSLLNMETGDWTADTSNNGIRALTFGGTDEYISGPAAADLESIGACTLAFWANRSSTAHLHTFGKVNGNNRLAVQIWNDGNLYFFVGNLIYGSIAYTGTGWHHYALVFDGSLTGNSNRLKGYVDGVQQSLSFTGTVGTTTPAAGIGSLLIGRSGSGYATGMFDDARAYATALSAGDITTLASARGIQTADTHLEPRTIKFFSTAGMSCSLFPNDTNVSIVDWYRYRSAATESSSDPGLYTATVDASWSSFRPYDAAGRATIADVQPETISLERTPTPRPVKVREPSREWTPECLSAGCFCFDPKPGYVFTDSAGTVLAKVGDSVLSMRCRYTDHLITASGAMTFKRDQWGGYYLDTNSQYFTVGSLSGVSNSQIFMSMAFRLTTGGSASALIGTQSSGAQRWYMAANGPTQFTGTSGTPSGSYNASYTNSTYASTSFRYNVWSALYAAGQASVYAGHYKTDDASDTGTVSYFSDALYFFKYAGNAATDGEFAGCVITKGATTAEERTRTINWLADQNGRLFIATVGNSLTAGTGSTGNTNGYPAQALTELTTQYGSSNYSLVNTGNPGATDLTVYNDFTGVNETAASYFNISAMCGMTPRIMAIWGITNSIGDQSYTARQAVDYLWDLCRKARQWGFKIMMFSCIDRNQTTTPPMFRSMARQANQLLDEEYTEFVDIYFPLHQYPQFRNADDTTYFNADKVHLNDDGYEEVKNYFIKGVSYLVDSMPNKVFQPALALSDIESSSVLALEATVDSGFAAQLTSQNVRDAMKLAPSAGAAAAGSIDTKLDTIDTVVDGITTAGVMITNSPVADDGQINEAIIIGDDYLAANDRAFEWTVNEVTGFVVGTSTCHFGGSFKTYSWLVDGDITDNGDGTWTLSFDLASADTTGLEAGYYDWSVEVRSAGGTHVTRVRSGEKVELVERQT